MLSDYDLSTSGSNFTQKQSMYFASSFNLFILLQILDSRTTLKCNSSFHGVPTQLTVRFTS